jgi:hypothetical protein
MFYDPKRDSESVQEKRQPYQREISQLDPERFMFIDEIGATLPLTPV